MLNPKDFYHLLVKNNYHFFTGVPDSTLKHLCSYIDEHAQNHIICANEGNAIAQGIGYYMATSNTPVIYMQNSGFGNALNPLISLASENIYQIPMLIIIGWRGMPNKKDEPQHIHQGKVMLNTLKALEFNYEILPKEINEATKLLNSLTQKLNLNRSIQFLVVEPDSFENYETKSNININKLNRPFVIQEIINQFPQSKYFASTGFIGRELFQMRVELGQSHSNDFLCIGGMGHVSQIALSYSKFANKPSIILDGDGSVLMHMGGLTTIQHFEDLMIIHIVLNNGCHLSVGGQPTVAQDVNLSEVARNCGYRHCFVINNEIEFKQRLSQIATLSGPIFLDIKVSTEIKKELMRPNLSPKEQLKIFMESK